MYKYKNNYLDSDLDGGGRRPGLELGCEDVSTLLCHVPAKHLNIHLVEIYDICSQKLLHQKI